MSDPGLAHRLSHRTRRAGLMIGISMVLTIAFCAVAFTVIFTALEGFTTDFVSGTDKSATVIEQVSINPEAPATEAPEGNNEGSEQQANQDAPNDQGSLPTPTPPPDSAIEDQNDEDEFDPDYQLNNSASINLREGPSTSTSIVDTLPPSTPLQYLGEDAPTDSPRDGDRWMKFSTEDGLEGWIREIDVTDYEP